MDEREALIAEIDAFLTAPEETWYLGHIIGLLERSRVMLASDEVRSEASC